MFENLGRGSKGKLVKTALAAALLVSASSDTLAPNTIEWQTSDTVLESDDVTVMTANVHGFEHYLKTDASNAKYVLSAIQKSQPDIICFQEFNPDHEKEFIKDLSGEGYNVVFTATVRQGIWGHREGNAIASRGKIDEFEAITLPNNNESIPRQLLIAEIATDIGKITVANTHLGLNANERWKQASYIEHLNKDRHLDCGDYNENLLSTSYSMKGGKSVSLDFLSPHKTQSTNTLLNKPTHHSGILIDRVSTDCGTMKPSVQNLYIGSDHTAPIGTFDLRGCLN